MGWSAMVLSAFIFVTSRPNPTGAAPTTSSLWASKIAEYLRGKHSTCRVLVERAFGQPALLRLPYASGSQTG